MLASSNLSVPGFATWDWSRPAHDERSSRRCCIDEFGAWLGKWVPCVRPLGILNGTMPCTLVFSETSLAPWPVRRAAAFVDAWLRSAAQVVMINNPLAGLLIMSACCFPSAVIGAHGALGLTGAVAAAFMLGLDRQALASGLFGYNGLLVGMALATLLYTEDGWDTSVGIANRQTLPPLTNQPTPMPEPKVKLKPSSTPVSSPPPSPSLSLSPSPQVGIACVVGGGLSAVVQLSLGNALVPTFHAPPFTLAFNVTMLLFVLGTHATEGCELPIHRLHTACALPSCTANPLNTHRRHPSL